MKSLHSINTVAKWDDFVESVFDFYIAQMPYEQAKRFAYTVAAKKRAAQTKEDKNMDPFIRSFVDSLFIESTAEELLDRTFGQIDHFGDTQQISEMASLAGWVMKHLRM